MAETDLANSDHPWTVRRIIAWTTDHLTQHGSETPRLDAEVLLAHARRCGRIDLYTRFDEVLTDEERGRMRNLVRRRAKSEPVAYLVGHREFFSLEFEVTLDVLIPRPDTETLVMELLDTVKESPAPRVLDLGTGSGCIAIATAANNPQVQMTAVDIAAAALEVARRNAKTHRMSDRIRFLCGDLFDPLAPDEQFEAIVSNPPYIREQDLASLQPDVRLHEPVSALVGGPDGLDVIRRLIGGVSCHLVSGGSLLLEISPEQATTVAGLLSSAGCFSAITVVKDLAGQERVVRAQRNG